jgi:hypothetical protein
MHAYMHAYIHTYTYIQWRSYPPEHISTHFCLVVLCTYNYLADMGNIPNCLDPCGFIDQNTIYLVHYWVTNLIWNILLHELVMHIGDMQTSSWVLSLYVHTYDVLFCFFWLPTFFIFRWKDKSLISCSVIYQDNYRTVIWFFKSCIPVRQTHKVKRKSDKRNLICPLI